MSGKRVSVARIVLLVLLVLLGAGMPQARARSSSSPPPCGFTARVTPPAYLGMPTRADGTFPARLSQTLVFSDVRRLVPNAGLIPYQLVVSFWSDGAKKLRWMALPRGRIGFAPTGEWTFPDGTVFIKHFELGVDESHPASTRRLETRLLVRDRDGGVYGATYKWRADNSDADLLTRSLTEIIPIRTLDGKVREQVWYYPSREDCLTCHTARAGGVLGVKTRQLNRTMIDAAGREDNQLRSWNHIGLFKPRLEQRSIAALPRLAALDDSTRTLEDRARSYLDANCAHCHRPGGTVANFDARYDTPLASQGLIDGPVLINQGIDKPRVIAPHDIWRSIAFMRTNTVGDIRMPPLARNTLDTQGIGLLRDWIASLPGPEVLPPPVLSPVGGTYDAPIVVALQEATPGADIHYTLDGTVPGPADPLYRGPVTLSHPVVLRARAYKEGYTRSITAQEVYVVGDR